LDGRDKPGHDVIASRFCLVIQGKSMLRALWLSLLVLVAVPAAAQEYRSK